jgi:hypothetical protein
MAWELGLLRPIGAIFRTIHRILTSIPFIDDLEARFRGKWLSPIVVRRIRRADDPDLQAALSLYEKRLDSDLRFQSSDIIRWVSDDARNTSTDGAATRDYFLVAKFRHKVLGFILFHYYPKRRIAFLAYMVVEKHTPGLGLSELSNALIAKTAFLLSRDKLLRNCQTLLFEVEDPRKALRAKQLHDIARIQKFCELAAAQKFTLRAFDIEYLQPALSVPDCPETDEQPLLLLSARKREDVDAAILLDELLEMLDFIYIDLYPEGFSDLPDEQEAYKAYCRDIRDQVVSTLPAKVKIINPAHITCGREVRKASRKKARETSLTPV